MKRTPATQQRSPWHRTEPMTIEGVTNETAQRNVTDGRLVAIFGQGPLGWHMSISHRKPDGQPGRYPRWDEIAHARDEFLPPDRTFVMKLPSADAYVSAYSTAFHLIDEDTIVDALEGLIDAAPNPGALIAAGTVLNALRPGKWGRQS